MIDYHDETLTLFLEFIDGATYDDILERDGFPAPEQAIKIIAEVLDGLAYAHKRRIVHRDIKPGNIFLTSEGRVKIADFGIAKILGGEHQDSDIEEGGWIGSPSYIAPEQILGRNVDGRADIYSTGIMLYLLLTHRLPFTGGTPRELASHHLNDPPPPPILIKSDIAPELNGIILKALEKDPERRFRDAAEFAEVLRAFIAPRQDMLYLFQAQEELERANNITFFRRKQHLDNACKLTELALGENQNLREASDLHQQIRSALKRQSRQSMAIFLTGGSAALVLAAGTASFLVKAPGTLDVLSIKPVDVIVDGVRAGTSPGQFRLSAGKHRLNYSIPGVIDFPAGGKEILIQENKILEETPVVPSIAEVLILSGQFTGAQISVDGILQSARAPSKLALLYGEHTVEVGNIKKIVIVDQDSLKVEF